MTMATTTAPDMLDKTIKKLYIKDGKRRVMTDSGVMLTPAHLSRRMFGRMRGGKYSVRQ